MAILNFLMCFIRLRVAAALCMMSLVAATPFALAYAQEKGVSFIRDAEIENTIRTYATPLFQVAGLEPSAINIYLVNDNTLNAFVAGGQKLFINTGLLMRSETPGQVIGVIAHETGHIAGGHLSGIRDAMKNSSAQGILAMILGGVAVLGGQSELGTAIISGGQQISTRSFLQYSRTQESAADAAATRFLDATGQSSQGLLEFFEILGDQELLSARRQDPYYRSHPLTRERVLALQDHIAHSANAGAESTPKMVERHARMKAKLQAFLEPFPRVMKRYPDTDTSLEGRYARAIAHFRRGKLDEAVPLIDGLIAERPQDPYFLELKGQMLFENGRAGEALPYYDKAVLLDPRSALLRRELARVQIEMNDPALLQAAIANLTAAVNQDRSDGFSWRQLAIAHGKLGNMGESSLAMAEEAMIHGKVPDAKYHAERAEKLLPSGSVGWLQAQDILHAVDNADKP